MRAPVRVLAAVALAGAAAVASLLALSHTTGGTIAEPSSPLTVRASFDTSATAFGDRVIATIAVEIDRRHARAQTLRLMYELAPLQAIGPVHTTHVVSGDAELVTVTVPAACVSGGCLAAGGVAQPRLAPVKASVATARGSQGVSTAWPRLAIRDRVRTADLKATAPPVQANASTPPATYRVAPATLATILDIVAVLLGVFAVGLAAWELELLARRRRRARRGPLARAISLVRSAQALPGPERRRALELLARVLGRGELQGRATMLAWSEPTPEPAEVERLVATIEREERL